jgi:hypothetical protein
MNDALVQIAHRLYAEFSPLVPLDNVVDIVSRCRSDLDAVPIDAVPELVERLARQRLSERRFPRGAQR